VSRTEGEITDQDCLKSLEPENGDKVTLASLGPEEKRSGESGTERPGASGESGTREERQRDSGTVREDTRRVCNRKRKD
jgi:hypothetical protein